MLKAFLTEDQYKALPANLQEHYKDAEGGYMLDVGAANDLELANIKTLNEVIHKERDKSSLMEKELKSLKNKFKGIEDPDLARTALEKISEIDNWDPDQKLAQHKETFEKQMKDKYDLQQRQLEKKYTDELEAVSSKSKAYRSRLEKELIENSATIALQELGVGKASKFLLPLIRERVQLQEDEESGELLPVVMGEDGYPRLSPTKGTSGNMSVKELVSELANDESLSALFPGSGATGTGGTVPPNRATQTGGGPGMRPGQKSVFVPNGTSNAEYRELRAQAEKSGLPLQFESDSSFQGGDPSVNQS